MIEFMNGYTRLYLVNNEQFIQILLKVVHSYTQYIKYDIIENSPREYDRVYEQLL